MPHLWVKHIVRESRNEPGKSQEKELFRQHASIRNRLIERLRDNVIDDYRHLHHSEPYQLIVRLVVQEKHYQQVPSQEENEWVSE